MMSTEAAYRWGHGCRTMREDKVQSLTPLIDLPLIDPVIPCTHRAGHSHTIPTLTLRALHRPAYRRISRTKRLRDDSNQT